MMDFTVLLLTPDFLTPNYGQSTYTHHVSVPTELLPNHKAAARVAVAEARDAAMDVYAAWQDGHGPEAFHVLAVYPGHLDDMNPEV